MTRCPRCQRRLPPKGECAVHGRPSFVADVVEDKLPNVVAPPGWKLGRLIAVGGSSLVYAVSAGSGAPAVLKWARWRERDLVERFHREAEVLQQIGPPATPAFFAHGQLDGWPYLLMEEARGETLAAWMARSGDQGAVGEIVSILMRLASALQLVHSRGFIHRDLKPENVMIAPSEARILDLGLAAEAGVGVPQIGAIVGTVHYLAPEQIRTGATIDRRADLYSFGVIAYELLAGVPPFVGERRAIEYQHQVGRPSPLRDIRPLPDELEQLVMDCLAKQPEARPQTADQLLERLHHVTAFIQTLKGVGGSVKKVLGAKDRVILAWIEGGDPVTVARAINDVHGIIVRSRAGGILAAFAAQHHDAPLAVALATCRELAHERCRVVIHSASALVRRSLQGKPSFYGPEIEQPASWAPQIPFTGLVLTEAAAELGAGIATPDPDIVGFWRELERDRTDATEPRYTPPLVGRDRVIQDIAAIASPGGMLIGISGGEGMGKSRVASAAAERLRSTRREVVVVRARRRLFGDRADDERLLAALGGGDSLAQALADAGARRVILVVDDAHLLSARARRELMRDDLALSRILTSRQPLFEVAPGATRRLAIELTPLSYPDAESVLRDLLRPARLIPDVLLQRLAIRAAGNPGLLVALARDIKHRGGVRRHPGSDDWYVAADEIDTLLAAPSAAWFAVRCLEELPLELAPLVRMASALGPRFNAGELAAVIGTDVAARLDLLVRDDVFEERGGWYELVDPDLADAIYDHALDERTLVHQRALRYWLEHRQSDLVGWLARVAHHAAGAGDLATAATCLGSLAREARQRGDVEQAAVVEERSLSYLTGAAPSAIADAVRALEALEER